MEVYVNDNNGMPPGFVLSSSDLRNCKITKGLETTARIGELDVPVSLSIDRPSKSGNPSIDFFPEGSTLESASGIHIGLRFGDKARIIESTTSLPAYDENGKMYLLSYGPTLERLK